MNLHIKHLIVIFWMLITANSIFPQVVFNKLIIEDEVVPNAKAYNFAFVFKNTSPRVLKISKLKTSCSCTIPKLEKENYLPGEKGEISGVFNIGDRTGVQKKEIIVFTNDIQQPQIKLLLKIKILNPIEINPRLIHWERNSKLEAKNVKLTFHDSKWTIESISFDKTKFTVHNILIENDHIIKIIPLSTKSRIHDLVKIKLKNDKDETKTIAIHALIK